MTIVNPTAPLRAIPPTQSILRTSEEIRTFVVAAALRDMVITMFKPAVKHG